MDGLTINASYNPQSGAGQAGAESEMGYGLTYTGVEGLTLKYATADKNTGTTATSGEQTAWHASYVFGPVTVTATGSDYDMSAATNDQDSTSYALAYTVSDEISVKYGVESHDSGTANDQDADYSGVSVTYTAGGMTVTAKMQEGENIDNSTNANADVEYWMLGAAFAF
tara:strand:- start:68 stop:574 length:507 start_codon:yes stop_codon:yes gene_type:complete